MNKYHHLCISCEQISSFVFNPSSSFVLFFNEIHSRCIMQGACQWYNWCNVLKQVALFQCKYKQLSDSQVSHRLLSQAKRFWRAPNMSHAVKAKSKYFTNFLCNSLELSL